MAMEDRAKNVKTTSYIIRTTTFVLYKAKQMKDIMPNWAPGPWPKGARGRAHACTVDPL